MFNNIEKKIRKLARSSYWQSIWNASKQSASVQLFENKTNLSYLQSRFLYWLDTYAFLYEELSTHADDKLTEGVIENDFRCDAYLTYKNKKNDFMWKKYREDEKLRELKERNPKKFTKQGKEAHCSVDFRREK